MSIGVRTHGAISLSAILLGHVSQQTLCSRLFPTYILPKRVCSHGMLGDALELWVSGHWASFSFTNVQMVDSDLEHGSKQGKGEHR